MEYWNNKLNIDFYIMNNNLTSKEKISIFISGVMGIVVGLITSVIVNITLAEISISPFFTIYFGLIFIILGTLMVVSVRNNQSYIIKERKDFILSFAIMVNNIIIFKDHFVRCF